MSQIIYLDHLYCPSCKAKINLDYSGLGHFRPSYRDMVSTEDLLIITVGVRTSSYAVKDKKKTNRI
ncbi:MAG: hypothetical protein ACFFB5_23190 [Promethearchaeota archaeon]